MFRDDTTSVPNFNCAIAFLEGFRQRAISFNRQPQAHQVTSLAWVVASQGTQCGRAIAESGCKRTACPPAAIAYQNKVRDHSPRRRTCPTPRHALATDASRRQTAARFRYIDVGRRRSDSPRASLALGSPCRVWLHPGSRRGGPLQSGQTAFPADPGVLASSDCRSFPHSPVVISPLLSLRGCTANQQHLRCPCEMSGARRSGKC